MLHVLMKALEGGLAAEMPRDKGWNQCLDSSETCNLIALRTASIDVEGSRRKVRRAAGMRRDKHWNRSCEQHVLCNLRALKLAVHHGIMWIEGVGWLGGWPAYKGTNNHKNQCQEKRVLCDHHRAWIEATCCSLRR
jgi:hypothetical protein